jgi:hypothetical protein
MKTELARAEAECARLAYWASNPETEKENFRRWFEAESRLRSLEMAAKN